MLCCCFFSIFRKRHELGLNFQGFNVTSTGHVHTLVNIFLSHTNSH